jgi:hypothetical protein
MTAEKKYKLSLTDVLNAIDKRDLDFYSRLTVEEQKSYTPLVLMRYMSSLTDQHPHTAYAVMATNDITNIGFWTLSKHPELQHKLLCLAGLGGKTYRPWISATNKKSNKIQTWLQEQYPQLNSDEIEIIIKNHTQDSWSEFLKSSGISDAEVKDLIAAWKKQSA